MFRRNPFGRSTATSHQTRGLRIEPLEQRTLLAVDALAVEAPLPDRFESNEELSDFFVQNALERYGGLFGQEGYQWGGAYNVLDDDVALSTASDFGAENDVSDHSETNVQVAGVDEADVVETDGEYLYMLSEGELLIIDVREQDSLRLISQTPLEDDAYGAHGIYLNDDRLTLISQTSADYYQPVDPIFVEPQFFAPYPNERYQPTLTVTVLDVSDRTSPERVQELEIDGRLHDSRGIGDTVFLVTSDTFGLPCPELHEVIEDTKDTEVTEDIALIGATDGIRGNTPKYIYETKEEYLSRIEGQVLELALPSYTNFDAVGSAVETGFLAEATDIYRPGTEALNRLTSIVTIDMAAETPGPASTTSLPSSSISQVYMSLSSLYLTEHCNNTETILKFDIDSTNQSVDLSAIGKVPGRLLNQFSIDEYDGYLRVATTQGWQTDNALFVLQQNGESLETVGAIEGFSPGERIYSARFLGDRAFVVTFRQTDPLFSIDLSDPTAPVVTGELIIPGFSNYLHPVDGDHLLGIGRNADPETGLFQDPQISLFDVGDMTAPELVDRYTIELGRAGSTEALYDHHAVGYYPEYQILAVPVTTSSVWMTDDLVVGKWIEPHTDLWVFQVDVAAGTIEKITQIEHESKMRRSVRIGEYLYAVSEGEVTAHLLTEMTLPGSKINIARAPSAVVYDPLPLEITDNSILTTGTQEEPLDLGSVDYRSILVESTEVEEKLWYEMTAVREGILTVTGRSRNDSMTQLSSLIPPYVYSEMSVWEKERGLPGNEPVSLYRVEPDGGLQWLASDTGRVDYDEAVAGQRYVASIEITSDRALTTVEIANVVAKNPSLGHVDIYDAQGEDEVLFFSSHPEPWQATIDRTDDFSSRPNKIIYNNISYSFDPEEFTSFVIHDVDSIFMEGAPQQAEHLESSPFLDVRDGGIGRAILSAGWGTVEAYGTDIRVYGGAEDTAEFSNHGLQEARFHADKNYRVTMSNTADAQVPSSHTVIRFGTIEADAHGMGRARLDDSTGADRFAGGKDSSELVYEDGRVVRVKQFNQVHAYSRNSGRDVASLVDSDGDDRFIGTPKFGKLVYDDGTVVRAKFFDRVHAYARNGGNNSATMTGGNSDQVIVTPTYTKLTNRESYFLRAKFFNSIIVNGGAGHNSARIYDSPGNDTLTSSPGEATFVSAKLNVQLRDFYYLTAKSTEGGFDRASLFDSSGNDRFDASPTSSTLKGPGSIQRVLGFHSVNAYAKAGGFDTANLVGSTGNDSVYATSQFVRVENDDFLVRAKFFEDVDCELGEGTDSIKLIAAVEQDLFVANANSLAFSENRATKRFDYLFSQLEYAKVYDFDSENDERQIADTLDYELVW